MKSRILTGVVIAGTLFPLIYLGGNYIKIALLVLMAIMAYEVSRMRDFKHPNIIMILILAAIIGLFFCDAKNLVFYLGTVAIILFIIPIFDTDFRLLDVVTLFILIFMATMATIGMINVRRHSLPLTFLVVFTNVGTDTWAFFVGKFFGKNKLAPTISPNKTREGALAGWIGGAGLVFLCRFLFCPQLDLLSTALIAVVQPFITQVGDLAFSLIKRAYGIKDFGKVFGEHGGIFDRIDSLIFALIFINFYLNVVVG